MRRVTPKFVKTPPAVLAAFDAAARARADVARKTMFSYPALFVNGNHADTLPAKTVRPRRASERGRSRTRAARGR